VASDTRHRKWVQRLKEQGAKAPHPRGRVPVDAADGCVAWKPARPFREVNLGARLGTVGPGDSLEERLTDSVSQGRHPASIALAVRALELLGDLCQEPRAEAGGAG
jgi:hypothetical protein